MKRFHRTADILFGIGVLVMLAALAALGMEIFAGRMDPDVILTEALIIAVGWVLTLPRLIMVIAQGIEQFKLKTIKTEANK